MTVAKAQQNSPLPRAVVTRYLGRYAAFTDAQEGGGWRGTANHVGPKTLQKTVKKIENFIRNVHDLTTQPGS